MGFVIWRKADGDLNTNERMASFYKKELRASQILERGKKQRHYGTKRYRKFVSYRFPGAKRYVRLKAIVSDAYRKNRKKYLTLSQLGKIM